MTFILLLIVTYLIGSIPFAYIIVKYIKKTDIRQHGSGNPGATNVFRVVGVVPGIITILLDILKGYLPVVYALAYFGAESPHFPLYIGLAAFLGHVTTPFLGFRGGKGVATGTGIFFALLPIPATIALACFLMIFFITRIVSISSILASLTLPVSALLFHEPFPLKIFAALLSILVLYTHRSNITRLITGQELGFKKTKKGKETP